jgi:hypothetical protein
MKKITLMINIIFMSIAFTACPNSENADTPGSTPALTDSQSLSTDKSSLSITFAPGDSELSVKGDLALPGSGPNGTSIAWSSSNPSIVEVDGTVTQVLGSSETITLIATITKGAESDTKEFTITVQAATCAGIGGQCAAVNNCASCCGPTARVCIALCCTKVYCPSGYTFYSYNGCSDGYACCLMQ